MLAVVIMLSTIFCAVPAFRRVEPVIASGPGITVIDDVDAGVGTVVAAHEHRARTAARPPRRAASTYGVRRLAAIPTTTSRAPTPAAATSSTPADSTVLHPFARAKHRLAPARDDALHQVRIDAEGGRALGRVENAETTAGAGAHVEQPSAPRETRLLPAPPRARSRGWRAAPRSATVAILVVHQLEDAVGGGEVDLARARVALLGREPLELIEQSAGDAFVGHGVWSRAS